MLGFFFNQKSRIKNEKLELEAMHKAQLDFD